MSNRSFYSTFTDKEECYLAAFDLGAALLVDQAKQAYRRSPGPWEARLRAGMETILLLLAANPAFARFSTIEPVRVGPVAVMRLNAVIRDCRDAFGGDEPANVPSVLQGGPLEALLVGAVVRPIFTCIEEGRAERLPELAPSLVDFLVLVIRGAGRETQQTERR